MEPIFTPLPPARRGGRPAVVTEKVKAALKARPGEWAIIHRTANSGFAFNAAKSHRGFAFTARTNPGDDGMKYDVYARFVGEDGEHA